MKAPEKYGGQLSGLRSISTFPLLSLYCREHYFPSPLPLWLPDRFSHERQYGRLKVGRGEKPRYFSPSLFPGASPPKFQPHPLCFQLLLGSLVLSLAPRDGSSFWVLTTSLSCSVLAASEVLMALLFVTFGVCHHRMFGFSILLSLCVSQCLC